MTVSAISSAQAYANNAVAYIAWQLQQSLPGCLGFEITRIYDDGAERVLAAWVPFDGQSNPKWIPETTAVWPVQKFTWRDLTVRQQRDSASLRPSDVSLRYRIRPVGEMRDGLQPVQQPEHPQYQGAPLALGYLDDGIETAKVEVTSHYGSIRAAFNSGILSTQWLSHAMQNTLGHVPSVGDVVKAIADTQSPIRNYLAGDIPGVITDFFSKLDGGGQIYLALYELVDPMLVPLIESHAPSIHLILSNTSKDKKTGAWDDENSPARTTLHNAGLAEMYDRMFNNSAHIGHNKFAVYVGQGGVAQAVLSGSTNWTQNGLCAQSNNIYVAESPELAAQFLGYWNDLKDDNAVFEQPHPSSVGTTNKQGKKLRTANAAALDEISLDGARLQLWRSPNTPQVTKPKNPALPPDLSDVFTLIRSARKAIFFAVFLPSMKGVGSVIEEAIDIARKDGSLLVYGTISNPMAMPNYVGKDDKDDSDDDSPEDHQLSIFEEGRVHVVRANALNAGDITGNFEREVLSAGNAIIHDKILIVDPHLPDECAVVTGSHNLGYKASYANDDNLLIIKGNQKLAQAYMVHVLDLYEHYRFRGVQAELKDSGKARWSGFLQTSDQWQNPTDLEDGSLANYLGSKPE